MITKNHILNKARQLSAEHSACTITKNDLTNDQWIYKRTIYVHFKNEILINYYKTKMVLQKTKDDHFIYDKSNCRVALLKFIGLNTATIKSQNPNYYQDLEKYYPETWESKIKKYCSYQYYKIHDLLKTRVVHQVFRINIDIKVVATHIRNIFKSVCSNIIYPKKKFGLNLVFENTLISYTREITSNKGLQYPESYRIKNDAIL
jgi:hypothetical protein